jgi:outer membrane autotransporter protein
MASCLDGVMQGTWYDFSTKPRRFLETDTDGFGFAASLEGGYPFHLGSGVVLEPQAQLIYQTLNISHAQDIAALIRFRDDDFLTGRLGARFAKT